MKHLAWLLILALELHGGGQTSLPQVQHGVLLNWIVPVAPSVIPTGYKVYRCFGTCALSSTQWILISGATPLAAGTALFLDSSTGAQAPNLNTQYSYTVASLDAAGNQTYSNILQITTPTAWPTAGAAAVTGLTLTAV